MSRYEWEKGTIRIPAKAWPEVKAAVSDAHDRLQAKRYDLAGEIHRQTMAAGTGRRNFAWRPAAEKVVAEMHRAGRRMTDELDAYDIIGKLLPAGRPAVGSGGAPLAPKRKDFPPANGATKAFECGEAHIGFDEKTKSIGYASGDNNKACETARAHPVVEALFKALDGIKDWPKGSGGKIVGNDEYNRDNNDDGGGGNYVTAEYPKRPQTLPRNYFAAGAHLTRRR